MIRTLSCSAIDTTFCISHPSLLCLFHGYFESLLLPKSINTFEVHTPTFLPEQACNLSIAVAREFTHELKNPRDQTRFFFIGFRRVALATTWLA